MTNIIEKIREVGRQNWHWSVRAEGFVISGQTRGAKSEAVWAMEKARIALQGLVDWEIERRKRARQRKEEDDEPSTPTP